MKGVVLVGAWPELGLGRTIQPSDCDLVRQV